MRIV
jgi:hypothetical protein